MASIPSFRKINYGLRPSKQVERRLIADVLRRADGVGYDVSSYRYLGFGSIYYADFSLFHRELRIGDMVCVESAAIPLAMAFNKPFEFVDLRMDAFAAVVPTLDRGKRHFVWLDYDSILDDDTVRDIRSILGILAPGSVFIITVQARPPQSSVDYELDRCHDERMASALDDVRQTIGRYRRRRIKATELSERGIARLYQQVLSGIATSSLASRSGDRLRLYQLFSFRYKDNVPMFTFGGIVDKQRLGGRFRRAGIIGLPYVQSDPRGEPVEISVPMLTARERLWLEQHLVDDPKLSGAFELPERQVSNFRRYYRQYPTYSEIIGG